MVSDDGIIGNGDSGENSEAGKGHEGTGGGENQSTSVSSSVEAELDARDADFSQLDAAEQAEDINRELAKVKSEVAEFKDKYLRSIAEFENYKKRALRERSDLLKYQGERIIADLLGVLDSIELALSHKDSDPEHLRQGLELIHKLFVDSLGRWEVRAVSGLGTKYDPNRFEALSKVEVADAEPGTIINEAQKAYMYKDRLLRPGKVVVAIKPEDKKPEEKPD